MGQYYGDFVCGGPVVNDVNCGGGHLFLLCDYSEQSDMVSSCAFDVSLFLGGCAVYVCAFADGRLEICDDGAGDCDSGDTCGRACGNWP